MKDILLIGNIGNVNSGPGYIINSMKSYLKKNNYNYRVIDTSKSKFLIFKQLLKLLKYKNMIVNVHSYGYKIPYIVMLISKINKKNKYFLTLHGISSVESEINHKKCSKTLEKKIIREFPNIICVSNMEKEILLKNFNRFNNVFVCYNGCDFYNKEFIHKKDKDIISLIDTGGVSRIKNTLEVLILINKMVKSGIKCKLSIYGKIDNKEYYEICKKYVVDNQIEDNFEFKGYVDRNELISSYKNSNYAIALSKFDTFNMTMLEALQTGTPIIISDNVGIVDIVEDKNCGIILKNTDDIEMIVNHIKQLSKDEYKILCKNSYITGHQYSQEYMNKRYLEIFGE